MSTKGAVIGKQLTDNGDFTSKGAVIGTQVTDNGDITYFTDFTGVAIFTQNKIPPIRSFVKWNLKGKIRDWEKTKFLLEKVSAEQENIINGIRENIKTSLRSCKYVDEKVSPSTLHHQETQ